MTTFRIACGALLVLNVGLGQALTRYQDEIFTGIKVAKNVVYGGTSPMALCSPQIC